jgi:hypothetical protein
VRLEECSAVVLIGAIVGSIALNVGMLAAVAVLAGTAATVGWACRRALRLALMASEDEVRIRNFWREHEFSWLDVTSVGVGEGYAGFFISTRPTISFKLRTGRIIHAKATPEATEKCLALLNELQTIAPPSVQFFTHPLR